MNQHQTFKTCILLPILLMITMVSSAQPGTARYVDELLQTAEQLGKTAKYDSAISLSNKALLAAKEKKYRAGEAASYDRLAEIMFHNGRMNEMNRYDSLLFPLANLLKDSNLLINAYNREGVYNMERGKTKESEFSFLQALGLGLEKRQSVKTAEVYSNLGSTYLATGDKNKSIEWFFKALRLYEKNNNGPGQGETYSNISSAYYLLGRVDDAIGYQKKSIEVREKNNDEQGLVITNVNIGQLYILKDSSQLAQQHLKKAVVYAEKTNNPRLLAAAYTGMLVYYNRMKDFPTALEWQLKAVKLYEETDNKPMLSRFYVASANLAHVTNDSAKAVEYYNKGLNLAVLLKNKENIANAYDKLSTFYQARNDPAKALQYYRQSILYKDSIASTSALAKIEEIRTKYETEKKDHEISRLNTEQKIRGLEIEKQKAIIAGNHAEAERKQNEIDLLSKMQALQDLKLQQQGEQLEKQALLVQNNQQQLKLAAQERQLKEKQLQGQKQLRNAMIGGAILLLLLAGILFNRYQLKKKLEQQKVLLSVRNDIAKDLHDEIGSTLTSIKILSEVSKNNLQKDQQKATQLMEKITEQSSAMQQGMSDIVWAIKPDNDKLENMLVRMREYVSHTLESKNIETVFTIDEAALSRSLGMQQRKDFFLVFKEAVNNAAKYSNASKVTIGLSVKDGNIRMSIADNGTGFDTTKVTSSNGLKNMEARTVALGGHFSIDSTPGQGTVVQVEVPAT